SARFKCFDASKISIPMIRLSAPISSTISSVRRLLTTSCLRSSSLMYTRSDLALYRISIVDLPFPVKDVNGYGDYNIPFDSKKDVDFLLLVVSAQACLVEVKDFALARTAALGGYRLTVCYYIYNLFRACASFGGAFESVRIDPNIHLSSARIVVYVISGYETRTAKRAGEPRSRQKHWRNLMRKISFHFALSALLLALCWFAEAQQPAKIPRVGYGEVLALLKGVASVRFYKG